MLLSFFFGLYSPHIPKLLRLQDPFSSTHHFAVSSRSTGISCPFTSPYPGYIQLLYISSQTYSLFSTKIRRLGSSRASTYQTDALDSKPAKNHYISSASACAHHTFPHSHNGIYPPTAHESQPRTARVHLNPQHNVRYNPENSSSLIRTTPSISPIVSVFPP